MKDWLGLIGLILGTFLCQCLFPPRLWDEAFERSVFMTLAWAVCLRQVKR